MLQSSALHTYLTAPNMSPLTFHILTLPPHSTAKRAFLTLLSSPPPALQPTDTHTPKLAPYTGPDVATVLTAVQNRPRSRSMNGGHSRKGSLLGSGGSGVGSAGAGHARNGSYGRASGARASGGSFGQKQMRDMMEGGDGAGENAPPVPAIPGYLVGVPSPSGAEGGENGRTSPLAGVNGHVAAGELLPLVSALVDDADAVDSFQIPSRSSLPRSLGTLFKSKRASLVCCLSVPLPPNHFFHPPAPYPVSSPFAQQSQQSFAPPHLYSLIKHPPQRQFYIPILPSFCDSISHFFFLQHLACVESSGSGTAFAKPNYTESLPLQVQRFLKLSPMQVTNAICGPSPRQEAFWFIGVNR